MPESYATGVGASIENGSGSHGSPVDTVIDRLTRNGYDPRPAGSGKWESRCPGHKGSKRNLSVTEGTDGAVLLRCHHIDEAGRNCPAAAIVAELGMEMKDLFVRLPGPPAASNGKPKAKAAGFDTPRDAADFLGKKLNASPVAHWIYRNRDRAAYSAVYRFDLPDGKSYRPVSVDPATGLWRIKDPPGKWLPYRVDEIAPADRVLFFEGEKCVDLARGLGLVATTTAHGAQSPHKTDLAALAGKEVVIVPDAGGPGEGYAGMLLGLLAKLQPTPTVKVLRLPGLAESEDIEQWVGARAGTTAADLGAELVRLAEACPVINPNDIRVYYPPADGGDHDDSPDVVDSWPEIDPAAFHGIAGEIVNLIDPHTEADRVATLIQFLVAFANLIGRSAHFDVGATRHYLSLFCVLVGATASGRKGTSWDVAKWVLELCDRGWGDDRIQSGVVSGEGLIHHVRDRQTELREVKGKKVEVEVDPGVPDKRLLIVETELSRALKSMNREGNTLSDVVRQAWDSGNLRTLGKHKPSKATGAHISVIGHSTQSDVSKHLTANDSANGFANRFLWAVVRRSKELPDGGKFGSIDWTAISRRMRETVEHARQVGEMNRDPAAAEIWRAVYGPLSEGKPGLLGAVTNRGVPQVLRVACVYALLDGTCTIGAKHLVVHAGTHDDCIG